MGQPIGNLWDWRGGMIPPTNAASELGMWGWVKDGQDYAHLQVTSEEDPTKEQWQLSLQPSLQCHAFQPFPIYLCTLQTSGAQGVYLRSRESLHGYLRRTWGISVSFCLIQMVIINTNFYSRILWNFLFLELRLWAGEPLCRAKTPLQP